MSSSSYFLIKNFMYLRALVSPGLVYPGSDMQSCLLSIPTLDLTVSSMSKQHLQIPKLHLLDT